MFDTTQAKAPAGSASAFVAPTERRSPASDVWAAAGRATELAYRQPAPLSQTVRVAIVLGLVVAAKLCSAGALP